MKKPFPLALIIVVLALVSCSGDTPSPDGGIVNQGGGGTPSSHQLFSELYGTDIAAEQGVFIVDTDSYSTRILPSRRGEYEAEFQLITGEYNAELKALLERDGQVEMAPIGVFRRGEEGQLIFEASRDTDWLNASMFGLPAFTIEPLAEELPVPMNVEKMEKRRPDVYYIPVNRRLVRWVAAAVVAIVVFLSASTSVEEVNRSAYTASFVPTEMLNANMQKDEPSPAEPEPTSAKVEVTPRAETKPAPVEKPKSETKVAKAPAPKREAAKTVEAAPQKRYYIVIASLASSEQAAQYMKGVGQKECPNMAVLQTKGKYRVYADRFGLDYIQLHGNESPEYCRSLRQQGLQLIKAFSIASPKDLNSISAFEGICSYYLFDTKSEKFGGSGNQFDWNLLHRYQGHTPFLLSGGINQYSTQAIKQFHHPRLAGIDINSRFEKSPGLKDVTRIKNFLQTIR